MLDVHPPHAPTHTWKDFFIHIANTERLISSAPSALVDQSYDN